MQIPTRRYIPFGGSHLNFKSQNSNFKINRSMHVGIGTPFNCEILRWNQYQYLPPEFFSLRPSTKNTTHSIKHSPGRLHNDDHEIQSQRRRGAPTPTTVPCHPPPRPTHSSHLTARSGVCMRISLQSTSALLRC